MEAQITVSILSWLLEDRLIKTLELLPKSTALPLNLCLQVQGAEHIDISTKNKIKRSAEGFLKRDIFFTDGNDGIARPRAELTKRSAQTPYIFMTDNDTEYQYKSIDTLYDFLSTHREYGVVDLPNDKTKWHRTLNGREVICTPIDYSTPHFVDIDLTGGSALLMKKEVAQSPNIIDTEYFVGTWDFDMAMNIRKKGWKIATWVDKNLISINDHSARTPMYHRAKVANPVRLEGLKRFQNKWGFSSEFYPETPYKVGEFSPYLLKIQPRPTTTDTIVVSRAIYKIFGEKADFMVLDKARVELMQKYFINSLNNQTDMDFTLYLVTGPKGCEASTIIENLNYGNIKVRFIYTDGDVNKWKKSVAQSKNWGKEADEGSPEDICKHLDIPKTTIMARMDNDDWVAPGWIAHMKYMAKTKSEPNFLINYQVIGQNKDGLLYHFFAPHNVSRTSPFIALVQRSEPRYGLYEDVHLYMGKKFPVVYTIPPSYTFMVVHGGNRSNRIYDLDNFYGEESEFIPLPNFNTKPKIRGMVRNNVTKLSKPKTQKDFQKEVIAKANITTSPSESIKSIPVKDDWRERIRRAAQR